MANILPLSAPFRLARKDVLLHNVDVSELENEWIICYLTSNLN